MKYLIPVQNLAKIRNFQKNVENQLESFINILINKHNLGDNDNVNLLFTTDNPIGTESVVDFNLLSEEEKSNLYLIENRGYILNHLNVTDLPYTNKWTFSRPRKILMN